MIQVPTGSHPRTYFCIEIMTTSQRHPNIQKLLCVLTIPKSKRNLVLKMTMTPKNPCKPGPDGPFENILQHEKPQHVQTSPRARIASQCTGLHTARVSTTIQTFLLIWCHNYDSVGIMTTLTSVWTHLLVETRTMWKPVHWLAMRAGGPVCTCCGFSCWRIFSNGPSGPGLRRFFGVIVIFNTKFVLDLGMVRTQRSFRIFGVSLGCCHYFYTKVCSWMTSGGDLYHARTSKLIRVANR